MQNTEKNNKEQTDWKKDWQVRGGTGKKRWSGRGNGRGCVVWSAESGGEEAENPLMLIVGSGLTPQSDWHFCHSTMGQRRAGWRLGVHAEKPVPAFCICILWPWVVVLIMWQLGRLIVDKQQDYEGLCGSKGSTGWERPVICEAERKLVRAGWSCLLPAYLRKWKTCAKRILK